MASSQARRMGVLRLIRHGETDWNRAGRVQGSTDVPLNGAGRRQAREAAPRFAGLPDPPTSVVTSDLSRASETAGILAAALGLAAPRGYALLRERRYGEAEGMRSHDAVARYGEWRTSEIPDAEPWPQLRARAVRAVHAVLDDLRVHAPESSSVLVVTHGALIRELVRHVTDERLPAPGTRLGNLEGVSLLVDEDRMVVLEQSHAAE